MDIEQQIKEALEKIKTGNDHEKANAFIRTELHRIEWLTHQQSIISQQARIIEIAVEALKNVDNHYMQYIENEIECDTAATRLDNTAEDALAEIKKLEVNPHVNP